MNKSIKTAYSARARKQPIAVASVDYHSQHPVWSFQRLDVEHPKWSIVKCEDIYHNIISHLKDYEGLTWNEIETASGGKREGSNSHNEPISALCKEAQKRLEYLRLDDIDKIFSLRINAKTRIFGIRNENVLQILWYDDNHEICPCAH